MHSHIGDNGMDQPSHKILDILDHLWPYLSGLFITLLAGFRLWWHDRKATRRQVRDNAAAIVAINHQMATKTDLHLCREDVRTDDKLILDKLDHSISENARQHQDIMNVILKAQTNDKK